MKTFHRTPRAIVSVAAALIQASTGVIVAAAVVALWHSRPIAAVIVYPFALFFVASRFRALCNMMHEAAHGLLARTPGQNLVLGHLLSLFDFTDFTAYSLDHQSHHRFLGDPTRDRDFAARSDLFAGTSRPFWKAHILRPLSLFHVPRYIDPVLWSKTDSWTMKLVRLSYCLGLLGLAHFVVGYGPMIAFYAIPYLTAYQLFRYWSDAVDHAGVNTSDEEIDRSRNHLFSAAPLNWLFFPRSDQFHLVHHLFPKVPTGKLADVHAVLLADELYAQRTHAFWPRLVDAPPDHLVSKQA